ncbi:hypothetical protein ABMA27_003312 [Loxostege sticticalis]|uniref:PiggyBac transposable element-derived protein domain-containing protein n=1 Tax=Loxostege sticticalis TaxID=481309 RepID=A0ABR3HSP3_LOXSC
MHFSWTNQPIRTEAPDFDNFYSGISPSSNLTSSSSELDIFETFVDEGLLEKVVSHINLYHRHFILNTDLRTHSRLHAWKDVTVQEMYHWSTNPFLNSSIYKTLMSRNRYTMILGMLHFSRPGTRQPDDPILSKINLVIDDARTKFQNLFIPNQKLCVDESIVPFKGRLIIKQYLPNKRNRFGIKLFVFCDVDTKIILDFIIYCGAETEIIRHRDIGMSGSVILTFLERYYFTNRIIYMDNWYSSPKLFDFLASRGIGACGTVKKTRKEMPKFRTSLKKGERDVKFTSRIMAVKWHDKKDVYILSTIHKDEMGPSEKMDRSTGLPVMKPECVLDYNKNMGIVDTNDMMLSSLRCIRKVTKWYKKLFFHIIDLHLLNSFHYFKVLRDDNTSRFEKFQLSVITQIVLKYCGDRTLPVTARAIDQPTRLLGNASQHMPAFIPNSKKLRCKVCSHLYRRRRETRYLCEICKVPLCVTCFRTYHERRDLNV